MNKQYENLAQVTKRINYDLKHGVKKQEVLAFLESVKTFVHTVLYRGRFYLVPLRRLA
jgi:hypothetical protein